MALKDKKNKGVIPADTQNEPEENTADGAARQDGGQVTSDGIVCQWQSDARKLALVIPDFDFQAALRNDTFRSALTSGQDVFAAYAEMIRVPDPAGRAGIAQNAQYARRGTGEATVNPSKLSSEDFRKYIESRKNA